MFFRDTKVGDYFSVEIAFGFLLSPKDSVERASNLGGLFRHMHL